MYGPSNFIPLSAPMLNRGNRLTPEIRPSAGNNLFVFALPN
jgi:hypothetical protein